MALYAINEAKDMTPREFRDWRKNIIGARAWCIQSEYDPKKCQKELDLVIADARERNQKVWDKYFTHAKEYVADKGLGEQEAHENAVMLAENRTVDRGYVPPHWAGWSECRECGLVPTRIGAGEKVISCPWCLTQFFKKED
jgi:hypothetical protein